MLGAREKAAESWGWLTTRSAEQGRPGCLGRQRARVGSKNCNTQGLAGHALHGTGEPKCLGHLVRQRARVGSKLCNTQGQAGHALYGAGTPSCLGQQNSLSRARRHGRCLERSPSCRGRSGFVLRGLLDLLLLSVCCIIRRSIHIDGPWAVGQRGALGLRGSATVRGSRPSNLLSLHRAECGANLLQKNANGQKLIINSESNPCQQKGETSYADDATCYNQGGDTFVFLDRFAS